ncbi:hypothetical protein [Streptomyces ziwulingensis]|uniref:Serine/arginine repetitive matrix protein 2 n=1 Tax=Streptomyces ziwulingensis TaxID=1045501 RepID=A0ABP9C625_9ACTN
MRGFETERQEWAGSRRERLFDTEQYLDLRRQRAVLTRTAIALAVGGVCFGVWALGWKDEPEPYRPPARQAPAGPQASAGDGAPGEETAPDAGEGTSGLPADFEVHDDQEGFRTALPAGWRRESQSSQYGIDVVDFRSADGTHRLQVFQLMEDSPYASVADAARAGRELDGYQEIHLEYVADPSGGEAAEHEYTAAELTGEAATGSGYHVVDRRFEATDGERYALIAYGPTADGTEDERELLDTARAWFCPPGAECPSPDGATP